MQRFRVGRLLFEKNKSVFSCLVFIEKIRVGAALPRGFVDFPFFVEFSSNLSVLCGAFA